MAATTGNPFGGKLDDPWPPDHPMTGERVAIFAFEVTSADSDAEDLRSYHVTPAESAWDCSLGPAHEEPQGITDKWVGCGTGTVVRRHGEDTCEVLPDDPRIV